MKLRKLLVLLLLLGAAFVLSACGKQGAQGETGDTGLKGETGAQGDKGATGEAGPAGAKGETGANGVGIQFSYGDEGILWRYIGASDWNTGVTFEDLYQFLETDAIKFDYYVDQSLSLSAGDPLIAHGNNLEFGKTAFSSVSSALTAIKAASAESGYKGAVLYLEAGVYADAITVDFDGLTIKGANTGLTLEHDSTFDVDSKKNTILTGVTTVTADGFTLRGVVHKNQFEVTDAKNLTIKEVVFTGNQSNGIVEFRGEHNENVVIDKMYSAVQTGARPVYIWGHITNFKLTRCAVLDGTAGIWDYIRVGSGTEGRLYGTVELTYNYIGKTNQSGFMDRLPSADKYIIKNNYLCEAMASIYLRSGAAANIEVVIEGNTFDQCGGDPYWDTLAIYPNDTMKISLNKNNFFDCKYASDYIVLNLTNDTCPNVDCSDNFFNEAGMKEQVKNCTGLTFAEAAFEMAELPVDRFSESKYEALFDKLAAEIVADFNAATGKSLSDASMIDTDHLDSDQFVTFATAEGMPEKWNWLFSAIAAAADEAEKDPEAAGFDWANVKSFFIPNVCGLFTMTLHKDTHFGTESLDYTDVNLVEAILDQYVEPAAPVDYDALLAELSAEFLADYKATTAADIESIDQLDTNYLGGSTISKFYKDETMGAKWGWLYEAVSTSEVDCTKADFDWTDLDNMGHYLANINGFFTKTQHKDTYCEVTSADFTDAANVKAVLDAYLNK
ncbi:MAG: hypothetical protein J6Y42_04520 [Bacilli bacterium]|nr:hypothetical protein [Bacilli bacterium]